MTNAEKTAVALKSFQGRTLKSKEIVALVLAAFPNINVTSILPSDYSITRDAEGKPVAGKYSTLFPLEKVANGYKVLEAPFKVASSRSRDTRTLASIAADLLASVKPAEQQETPFGEASEPSDAELEALTAPAQ